MAIETSEARRVLREITQRNEVIGNKMEKIAALRKQLAETRAVCHLLAEAKDIREVARAQKAARDLLMSTGEHVSQSGQVGIYPWTHSL